MRRLFGQEALAGRLPPPALRRRKVLAGPSRESLTFICAKCRKETPVTAGTIMHRSHLPLAIRFWAAFLMAAHSNGMSALQLQSELGLGSYKTAWLLAMKLRLQRLASFCGFAVFCKEG